MKQKHIVFELSKADYVTLTATFLIVNAFWLVWFNQIYLAVAVAFVSTFLDYLDGVVARKYGGSPYGKVLDSLYDVLGWVLFPALILNIQAKWEWWVVIITSVYCVFSIIRLSRFTTQGYVETDKRYYVGLPVLFSKYPLVLAFIVDVRVSVVILAVMIPLMVSSRLIKKPHPLTAQIELLYAIIFFLLYLQNVKA